VSQMFERFTEQARNVLIYAQEEASHLRHNYIGTEHLLLGLLREGARDPEGTLAALRIGLDEVRGQVESIVGHGEEGTGRQAPFTPRSKKVLELASLEARQLGHERIGAEHLLLGVLREPEGVAARILSVLEVDAGAVRWQVLRSVSGESSEEPEAQEFQARMGPLRVRARFGEGFGPLFEYRRTERVTVDLDYAYAVRKRRKAPAESLDHGSLQEYVVRTVEEGRFESLEAVATEIGGYALVRFPMIFRVTVSVVVKNDPVLAVATTLAR
jgi:ATP-dependent Clp protease ATP-binding subunit ClpA